MLKRLLLLRALAAFLALPGVVAFLVPLLIAAPAIRDRVPFRLSALIPLVAGVALLIWCVRLFLLQGKGTLAPWDPPRQLVVSGPYAFSRNPMYVGVLLILIGWAVGFHSLKLLVYAVIVLVAFHLRVRLGEEPWLKETYHEKWNRYAAHVPRWMFRSRRAIVVSVVLAVVLFAFGGLVYEAYADAEAARQFPPPGMLVDMGGRRLHLICIGNGSPTVLFEPSGFGNATSGDRARERISSRTRVCSYDRIGMGWSDPGPASVTAIDLANDLAVLQDRAALGSPMVIVASSIGGLTAEAFARKYPERVAGLVFLDAANSLLAPKASESLGTVKAAACTASASARFGTIRLIDPFGIGRETSDGARRSAAVTYSPRLWDTMCAMARGAPESLKTLAALPPLASDVPLRVLSASSDVDMFPGYQLIAPEVRTQRVTMHQAFARQSTRGQWTLVPNSTHLLAGSAPDAVAETVLKMLEEMQ
jgi:pimeloyl-ACP methyl ester carboxylesterase/protein-S-isoprenylcysteine O-methyltransferase Ste14